MRQVASPGLMLAPGSPVELLAPLSAADAPALGVPRAVFTGIATTNSSNLEFCFRGRLGPVCTVFLRRAWSRGVRFLGAVFGSGATTGPPVMGVIALATVGFCAGRSSPDSRARMGLPLRPDLQESPPQELDSWSTDLGHTMGAQATCV